MTNKMDGHEYGLGTEETANIASDFERIVAITQEKLDFLCSLGVVKESFDSKLPEQVTEGDENHIYRGEN